LEQGNPINARGFHRDAGDAAGLEPIGQGFQVSGEGAKLPNRTLGTSGGDAGPMFAGTNIDASGMDIDRFPCRVDEYFFVGSLLF
jgi:hypothetical protein